MNNTEDERISIVLTVADWNQVLQGLLELPARIANPISTSIVTQAKEQLKPVELKE